MTRMNIGLAVLVLLMALGGVAQAGLPVTYNFSCIPDPPNGCLATNLVGTQLSVTVSEGTTAGTIDFRFENAVGLASSVTQIYFDDMASYPPADYTNALFDFTPAGITITESGADFSIQTGKVGNLPRGNTLTPSFSEDAEAFSVNPVSQNGINATGDYVIINIPLLSGLSHDDVIANIDSGLLRIGLHVQALENGSSDAYILDPTGKQVIPEPSTYFSLLAAGLGGMLWYRRRQLRNS